MIDHQTFGNGLGKQFSKVLGFQSCKLVKTTVAVKTNNNL